MSIYDTVELVDFITTLVREALSTKRFAEIYYQEVQSIDANELMASTREAVENLLQSDRYKWIVETASRSRRDWLIEPHGFGETRVGGLKAYCKVDFLFPVDGLLHIIDWKTGKERLEKHSSQIVGYAAWAAYHFEKPVTQIRPIVAYLLPEYRETTHELGEDEMQTFEATVLSETQEMYAFCVDVQRNIPKPKDAFALTKIEAICSYCNYRELCNRS